jgi:hypothetical protein
MNNLGCIFNEDRGWVQSYDSTYNQLLNSLKIIQEFEENNIHNNYSEVVIDNKIYKESIIFSFGKSINNDSIEKSQGSIEIWLIEDFPEEFPEGHTNLHIWLDKSKYPPVKDKKNLYDQKPLLEKSVDYMLNKIYNATGQWPESGSISIGDTD